MTPHDRAIKLVQEIGPRDHNEANTRHHIIDTILHDVLSWPKKAVTCEESTNAGYLDYQLLNDLDEPVLILEAKKDGVYFEVPNSPKRDTESRRVRLRTLLTVPAIRSAVSQVKEYATDIGSDYAGITNGHEWILFRTFKRGKRFGDLSALVIPSIRFFSESFTAATNLLGYSSVVSKHSLHDALDARSMVAEIYTPKHKIADYDALVTRNVYAQYLTPIGTKIFGDIDYADSDFVSACYVEKEAGVKLSRDIEAVIGDSLTPFLENEGIRDVSSSDRGDLLVKRVDTNIRDVEGFRVVLLFGGKGSGKSTFLNKILLYNPSDLIRERARPAIIDLLSCPPLESSLTDEVWNQVIATLDIDNLMEGSIEILEELFSDRFDIAQRQNLAGFEKDSEAYNKIRNGLIMQWKEDRQYCAERLARHLRRQSRQFVLVLDNTDQLPGKLQDFCFLLAKSISERIRCLVILSMREERYFRIKAHGVLDAYVNVGYHLSAPKISEVLSTRIDYTLALLSRASDYTTKLNISENSPAEDLSKLLSICREGLVHERGKLHQFLEHASRGNIRSALDFFRDFMTSGYTNVKEMLERENWTIAEHQVIRPIMIPERHNYDEDRSRIPDIFQLRATGENCSHFTGKRLLDLLSDPESDGKNFQFKDLGFVLDFFQSMGDFERDCEANLEIMLQNGLIEANNRLETMREERLGDQQELDWITVDALRITPFGHYISNYLWRSFTYLDLVCMDCGLRSEQLFNDFCLASKEERKAAFRGEATARLQSRLKRVAAFLDYLIEQENYEQERYSLPSQFDSYARELKHHFETVERPNVNQSVERFMSRH